jgi:hypothetical protein
MYHAPWKEVRFYFLEGRREMALWIVPVVEDR